MPKITVKYMREVVEEIEWPEDEMKDFDYDTLECNLGLMGQEISSEVEMNSISSVQVDGEEYEF